MMRKLILLIACVWFMGCAALPGIIKAVSEGGHLLSSFVDVADTRQRAYFARHPSLERSQQADTAISQVRLAIAAFDYAAASAQAADDQDLTKSKAEALKAYGALRDLLDEMGVLTATAPDGGADGNAPAPEPFELPTADDLSLHM